MSLQPVRVTEKGGTLRVVAWVPVVFKGLSLTVFCFMGMLMLLYPQGDVSARVLGAALVMVGGWGWLAIRLGGLRMTDAELVARGELRPVKLATSDIRFVSVSQRPHPLPWWGLVATCADGKVVHLGDVQVFTLSQHSRALARLEQAAVLLQKRIDALNDRGGG